MAWLAGGQGLCLCQNADKASSAQLPQRHCGRSFCCWYYILPVTASVTWQLKGRVTWMSRYSGAPAGACRQIPRGRRELARPVRVQGSQHAWGARGNELAATRSRTSGLTVPEKNQSLEEGR
jgi:hypothetical protein